MKSIFNNVMIFSIYLHTDDEFDYIDFLAFAKELVSMVEKKNVIFFFSLFFLVIKKTYLPKKWGDQGSPGFPVAAIPVIL